MDGYGESESMVITKDKGFQRGVLKKEEEFWLASSLTQEDSESQDLENVDPNSN